MRLKRSFALCLLIAVAGCGAQNTSSTAPSDSSSQSSQSAPAPAQAGSSILHHEGCTIDIVKVCKSFIDQPQFNYNGDVFTWERFQQTSTRHPDVEIWARYPDHSVVADIECNVDTQNRKVDWARLLPNPPLTDKSWAYAKSKHWCQEDSPDYSSWVDYWRSETIQQ